MDKDPLAPAKRDLEHAERYLAGMRAASNFSDFEREWAGFLWALDSSWNKVRKAADRLGPAVRGWVGQREGMRTSDPLLAYLMQARNARDHGVDEVVKHDPGGWGVNPAPGHRGLHIKRMEIRNGRIVDYEGSPAKLTVVPSRVVLQPVANRGKTYLPPREHLDRPLHDNSPFSVAASGILYYRALVWEMEEWVRRKGS